MSLKSDRALSLQYHIECCTHTHTHTHVFVCLSVCVPFKAKTLSHTHTHTGAQGMWGLRPNGPFHIHAVCCNGRREKNPRNHLGQNEMTDSCILYARKIPCLYFENHSYARTDEKNGFQTSVLYSIKYAWKVSILCKHQFFRKFCSDSFNFIKYMFIKISFIFTNSYVQKIQFHIILALNARFRTTVHCSAWFFGKPSFRKLLFCNNWFACL